MTFVAFGVWDFANGTQIWQISAHKFCIMMLLKLNDIFPQILWTDKFLLVIQSLVKSTPKIQLGAIQIIRDTLGGGGGSTK